MACSQQNNQRFRNLDTVRILAQKAADMLQVDMKIYKTICDGVQIFKFSEDWSGNTVETVRFSREYSSENILPNKTMNKGHEIQVLDRGFVRYIDHMGTDERIVEAARISYKSPSKGEDADKKLLQYLYKNKHTSPFEMCKITFNIKMPIFVMRQFVRHRMQNLNEVSARYTELPGEFYIPPHWRLQDAKNKQGSSGKLEDKAELFATQMVIDHCKETYQRYQNLLALGIAKEMARFVLPVNIYTEIYCCWDLKNLMHFFSLRDDPHAQWEHQQFSKAMKQIANRTVNDEKVERADKFRDMRVFNMLSGQPNQDFTKSNRYLNLDAKEFKRTDDLGRAAQLLPGLINRRIIGSAGNPEKLKSKMEGLAANNFNTMPSMTRMPIAFSHYYQFLSDTQGKENADARMEEFLRQQAVNQAKGSMVPRL